MKTNNGAATSVAEKHGQIHATKVASPREMQSGAATSVAEKDGDYATEVASPKGYKQTKVGVIPEEWEVVTLKNILSKNIQNGYSPICPEKDTGHWILGLGALSKEEKLNISDRKPAPINDDKVKQFILEKNDFLISRANTPERVGFSGVFRSNDKTYSYPDLMMRFRVTEELVDIDYMENCLKSFRVLRYLQLSAAGSSSSMVKINKKVVENIRFLLPPLKEQQKIAKILTTWDKAIEKLEALITAKEQLKKGLMQKLLGGEVRFDGFDEEWAIKKINELFEITRGHVLAVTKMKDMPTDEYKYPVFSSQTKDNGLTGYYNEYLFENCITWTTDGANAGDVNFREGKFYCTNVCGVLKSNEGYANQCIAYVLNLVTKKYVSYVGNPKLMNNTMGIIKIKIPKALKEQQKIAEVLTTTDREIELLKEELEVLKEQKRGLMQKLLMGEVRVKIED